MKRLFVVLALIFAGFSAFADVTWLSKEEVEDFQSTLDFDVEVLSVASCDTQEEVEKVCKVYSLDEYFVRTITTDNTGLDCYAVIFVESNGFDLPRIFVFHYMLAGQIELYMIF